MSDVIEEKDKVLSFTLFKVEKGRGRRKRENHTKYCKFCGQKLYWHS